MKKKSSKPSAFFEPRVFISFLLVFGAVLFAFTAFAMPVSNRLTPDVQSKRIRESAVQAQKAPLKLVQNQFEQRSLFVEENTDRDLTVEEAALAATQQEIRKEEPP